jgi:L-malate glycosyltransferase
MLRSAGSGRARLPAVPRVLHLGPLHSVHLRRWCEITREAGAEPHVGGLALAGNAPVDFGGAAETVHSAPGLGPPLGTIVRLVWVRRILRSVRPDIVHAHHLPSWGALAALARCRPLVVSVWGSDVYFSQGPGRRAAAACMRRADRLLAPSPHLLRELIAAGADPDRCAHVDLGVDLEEFVPRSESDAAWARRELGLGEGPVVFSFRGGYPAYNLPTVVEAFGLLRKSVPDAQLLVAHGRGELGAETEEALARVEAAGAAVRVIGDVPPARMPACYQAATLGVSIPSSDGSPRSVWEGLACGLPMVLSDLPQIRERVGESGAVTLVEPRPGSVAEALAEVVRRPELARSMATAAREWAVSNIDHRDHVARLRQVYESVSARTPRRSGAASTLPSSR